MIIVIYKDELIIRESSFEKAFCYFLYTVLLFRRMAKTIDTLKSASILTKAGANKELAEAIVEVVSDVDAELATKADITRLETKIELSESRMANRIYSIGIAIGALVVGMNVFF